MSATAEKIASQSSDDDVKGPAEQERSADRVSGAHRMENDLEMNKADKPKTTKASEVAGREGKGMGLADKLIGKSQ
ncbi:hypothetical protein MBLNU459_g0922t1 [Dothideomycetes sp. NU459]